MPKVLIKGPIIPNSHQWIYDLFDMEATSPKKVSDELSKSQNRDLEVEINSGGGSVFDASEIYTALKNHKGNVQVNIVGIAASAASVIAMAGNKISMSPTAQMMIHNASSVSRGDYRDMDRSSNFLQNVNKTIANAYKLKSGKSDKELLSMMDDETWMTAQQALEHKLIDEVMFEKQVGASASASYADTLPEQVIEKIRNEFANETMEQANSTPKTGASGGNEGGVVLPQNTPMASNQTSVKGAEEDMDLEKLKNDHPELFKKVKAEGYDEGVKAENTRIKDIEDLDIPGSQNLIHTAKFENKETTAADLAIQIVRAQKEQGTTFLNNSRDDAQELDSVQGSAAPEGSGDQQQDQETAATSIADVVNSIRGGRE
ncbi:MULTISPECIES: head maturation protease, ClpP-related [Pontibacillus]|uniref:ATP-dependent Clp protease proteolytic subunit n=1 Tax=Pontibacillus chungwhensis TaxID=265426 RepID=A0ABY8UZX5_9BACI|nr:MULTISPECIES: head maturation protease, ClpP-related [Pontibacillus]MCD5324768.1 Clp protease ClpP [Pontibacillus sp. HN14]WIF98728.1 Clp protease ClpP [Pontibacillus chungwhensis]